LFENLYFLALGINFLLLHVICIILSPIFIPPSFCSFVTKVLSVIYPLNFRYIHPISMFNFDAPASTFFRFYEFFRWLFIFFLMQVVFCSWREQSLRMLTCQAEISPNMMKRESVQSWYPIFVLLLMWWSKRELIRCMNNFLVYKFTVLFWTKFVIRITS
jgi:hypothetical protein